MSGGCYLVILRTFVCQWPSKPKRLVKSSQLLNRPTSITFAGTAGVVQCEEFIVLLMLQLCSKKQKKQKNAFSRSVCFSVTKKYTVVRVALI